MAQTNGDAPRELFRIDGNSLAYRAFFALPESIATSDGRPTNAIFGFASMLVKILTDYGEVPTVVVWDAGMSGRKEISADYKAQRSTRPDLLKLQWPHLRPLVDAFGYRNVSVEGFEADDVIAALVDQARERGIPVMVVTGDRDAYQLVGDGVRIMTTSRGITDTKVYDYEGVVERYGIPPEKIPDFIGLKGDTSDNIPGVPGIGDKTAAELLQRYGDLEGVLSHVDEISGAKRKQNLTEHADAARLSKQLATMVRSVPIDLDLEAEFSRRPDRANLRTVFREWELRDPLRRLEEALFAAEMEAIPRPETADARTVPVKQDATPQDVARLRGDELYLVATAPEVPEGELLPREPRWRFGAYARGASTAMAGEIDHPAELVRAAGDRPVVAHDAKALGEVPPNLVFDTELAAYLLDPARRGFPLDELAEERGLAVSADDENAARAVLVHDLAERQRPQLTERGLTDLLTGIELPLVHVLRETEKAGMKLDTRRLEEAASRIRADAQQLEREIWDLAGEEFMIGSPQQLAEMLFVKLGLSRKRRGKTGFSTDARVLQAIRDEHPIVPKIERWRELTKLVQTYLDALPAWIGDDGRLHTTFLQTNAATGRLASINPNLQNIPIRTETGRVIRACFVAEPGNVLISVDYEQVELRVLAHIANEQVLRDIFLRGEDVHTETASKVFELPPEKLDHGMRSKAKMVNYGIVYGLSAYGLADRLQIAQEEAQEFIDRYLERFPAVHHFMKDAVEQAEQHGYVSTLFGRRRQVPEIRARNWQTRKLGERLAVNSVIQGTAADIIKVAMVRAHDALAAAGLKTRLILQIHDELLAEGPAEEAQEAAAIISREMCGAADLDPPLVVDAGTGPNWLEAK
jgi:DNA polymerase I